MSYCRWSSDDFRSDVYCYHDMSGHWVIHVAGMRHQIDPALFPPESPPYDPDHSETWARLYVDRHQRVMELIRLAPTIPIGGPHDGVSFYLDTPGEAADKLYELSAEGYHVPDAVIDDLRAEDEEG